MGNWRLDTGLLVFGDPMARNTSTYENRQRAVELQNAAAHTHRVAEQKRGEQEHLTAHEQTRKTAEHTSQEQEQQQALHGGTTGHGVVAFTHEDIAARAYSLWEARGCPEGSADEDWFRAAKELRSMAAPVARA